MPIFRSNNKITNIYILGFGVVTEEGLIKAVSVVKRVGGVYGLFIQIIKTVSPFVIKTIRSLVNK